MNVENSTASSNVVLTSNAGIGTEEVNLALNAIASTRKRQHAWQPIILSNCNRMSHRACICVKLASSAAVCVASDI